MRMAGHVERKGKIYISNFCRKSCRKETTCKRLGTFKDNNKLNLKEEDEKDQTGLIWLQIGKIR